MGSEDLFGFLVEISSDKVKAIVRESLTNAPEYFWTLPASTSGKYHGKNEKLIDHVINCCKIMSGSVFQQMVGIWKDREKDAAISAMILHEIYRCGKPGEESRDEVGELTTHPAHGMICADILTKRWKNVNGLDTAYILDLTCDAIRMHMGLWGGHGHIYNYPYHSVVVQVHNVDAHQAWNMSALRKKQTI